MFIYKYYNLTTRILLKMATTKTTEPPKQCGQADNSLPYSTTFERQNAVHGDNILVRQEELSVKEAEYKLLQRTLYEALRKSGMTYEEFAFKGLFPPERNNACLHACSHCGYDFRDGQPSPVDCESCLVDSLFAYSITIARLHNEVNAVLTFIE